MICCQIFSTLPQVSHWVSSLRSEELSLLKVGLTSFKAYIIYFTINLLAYFLHYISMASATWEVHPFLPFCASRFHHAQLLLKLAQEAKAPRSSSIIWYHLLWSSRAKFLILFTLFWLFRVVYHYFYMSWLFCTN